MFFFLVKLKLKYLKLYFRILKDIFLNENVKRVISVILNIFVYGVILSIPLALWLDQKYDLTTVIAVGIVWYFIKGELPRIISSCFPVRHEIRRVIE